MSGGGPISGPLTKPFCGLQQVASVLPQVGESLINIFQKPTGPPTDPPPSLSERYESCVKAVHIVVPIVITLVCLGLIGFAIGFVLKKVLLVKAVFGKPKPLQIDPSGFAGNIESAMPGLGLLAGAIGVPQAANGKVDKEYKFGKDGLPVGFNEKNVYNRIRDMIDQYKKTEKEKKDQEKREKADQRIRKT